MNKSQYKVCLGMLTSAGLANTPKLTMNKTMVWYANFYDVPYKFMAVAIMMHIRKNKFYPTIAELLELVDIVSKYNDIINGEKAWQILTGGGNTDLLYNFVDVRNILSIMGTYMKIGGKIPDEINTEQNKMKFIEKYDAELGEVLKRDPNYRVYQSSYNSLASKDVDLLCQIKAIDYNVKDE
jgi:hypothetical protein